MYAVHIRCNLMHPLYDALPEPYVPIRITRGAVIAERYTYALRRCRTSQYRMTLFLCQCLCGEILVTPYSIVWDWRVSRAGSMPFYWPSCSLTFCLLLFSLFLLSFYGLVLWGKGIRTDRVLIALFQPCTANLLLLKMIIIIMHINKRNIKLLIILLRQFNFCAIHNLC